MWLPFLYCEMAEKKGQKRKEKDREFLMSLVRIASFLDFYLLLFVPLVNVERWNGTIIITGGKPLMEMK